MYRKFLSWTVLVTTLLAIYPPVIFATESLTLFSTPKNAQEHCPYDEVVWLNLPTGIWHRQGQRWYGATKRGAYVCVREALAAGNRASLSRY